jgi:hypothetical protein
MAFVNTHSNDDAFPFAQTIFLCRCCVFPSSLPYYIWEHQQPETMFNLMHNRTFYRHRFSPICCNKLCKGFPCEGIRIKKREVNKIEFTGIENKGK